MIGSSTTVRSPQPVNKQRRQQESMDDSSSFDGAGFLEFYISDLKRALDHLDHRAVDELISMVLDTRAADGSIHFLGNGGSAATPSHSAGDWSKEIGIRTIAHTDNTAMLTAFANDNGYDQVFVGTLGSFLRNGDLVIGFSGSGNSSNVINGMKYAKANGGRTVGVTGNLNDKGPGLIADFSDLLIHFETNSMERIEDLQLVLNHIVKESIKAMDASE